MDDATASLLLEVNRRFYARYAADFDRRRQRPWPGWRDLLPHLPQKADGALEVLDAGCGNGRYGSFLADHLAQPVRYLGIDGSRELLDLARSRLADRLAGCELVTGDLLDEGFDDRIGERHFGWIALFGVLHHVPSFERRAALLRRLGRRLGDGGRMAVSLWRFDRDPSTARRTLPWPAKIYGQALDPTELDAGDHLLSWGGRAECPRYCHLTDDAEADRLLAAAGLRQLARLDPGRSGYNVYLVLGR